VQLGEQSDGFVGRSSPELAPDDDSTHAQLDGAFHESQELVARRGLTAAEEKNQDKEGGKK